MKNSYTLSGNIVDVVNKSIYKGKIYVENGIIINIEKREVDEDIYIVPGLVDSHIHIESSMLIPSEFAKVAVKFGTVSTVSDPHEIANVLGIPGVDFMINNGKKVSFKFYFGAPSCVPATQFETSGATIGVEEIRELLSKDEIHYLSEMMNYPGVIFEDKDIIEKLNIAKKLNKPIDGHAPGIEGEDLIKYFAAGISTDHECFTKEEAIAKINNNVIIQIREGSAAKNYEALYELIDEFPDKVMLCSDDLHPDDLVTGHIDKLIRRGLSKGVDFFNLLRAVTYNPVKHYNLSVGLLQIGDKADHIIVNNLDDFKILETFIDGVSVYKDGKSQINYDNNVILNNFNCSKKSVADIVVSGNIGDKIRVIEAKDGELVTGSVIVDAKISEGLITPDLGNDVLKIVVVNRYNNEKPIVGFIKGFGLAKGAIASSIAHDSHNIISVGTNDNDIIESINLIIANEGGIAVCNNDEQQIMALNIAGIMTSKDSGFVSGKYKELTEQAQKYGSTLNSPFMTLSFMALLVIPELKIGDKGIFDGNKFKLTKLKT